MTMIYKGPGRYVAICNTGRFDGHYIKVFEVPADAEAQVGHNPEAAWWFLNRVDLVACIDAVYPLEIFRSLAALNCPACNGTGSNTAAFPIQGCKVCDGDGLLMPKKDSAG